VTVRAAAGTVGAAATGAGALAAGAAGTAPVVRAAEVGVDFPATLLTGVAGAGAVGTGTAACTKAVCKPRPTATTRVATSACLK
jgi:hypothetical protein